jgi:hypothetical protein
LEGLLLLLSYDVLDFLSLLSVVLVLEHQHISLLDFKVESSVLKLFSLFCCLFFEFSELSFAFLNNCINISKAII